MTLPDTMVFWFWLRHRLQPEIKQNMHNKRKCREGWRDFWSGR